MTIFFLPEKKTGNATKLRIRHGDGGGCRCPLPDSINRFQRTALCAAVEPSVRNEIFYRELIRPRGRLELNLAHNKH